MEYVTSLDVSLTQRESRHMLCVFHGVVERALINQLKTLNKNPPKNYFHQVKPVGARQSLLMILKRS